MDIDLEPLKARDIIIFLDVHFKHVWDAVYKCILNKDTSILNNKVNRIAVETELFALLGEGYKVLCILDEEYPKELHSVQKPPFVIYYKCKLDEVKEAYFKTYDSTGMNLKRVMKGCFIPER